MPNKIEQSHWTQKLAQQLDIREDAILDELKKIKPENIQINESIIIAKSEDIKQSNDIFGRKKLIEEKIVSLVLKDPENLNLIEKSHCILFCDQNKNFIESLKNGAPPEEYKDFINTLSLRAEVEYEEDGCQEIQLCLAQLKDIDTREKRIKISKEIKLAEQEGDTQKVNELIKEFNLLNKDYEKKQS